MKKFPILLFLVFLLVSTLNFNVLIVKASPDIEILYVESFSGDLVDWDTLLEPSPYLNDNSDNWIYEAKTSGAEEGYFGFADLSGGASITSVTLYVECYGGDVNDQIQIYVNDGVVGFTLEGTVTVDQTVYAYETLVITTKLDTDTKVNAAQIYLVYQGIKGGDDIYVRRAYLYVDYTPAGAEYFRTASQSLSFSLSAIKLFEVTRGVDQSVGISLDRARLIDVTRTATQGIGVGLSTDKILNIIRDVTQTIGLSLATARIGEFSRSGTQSITMGLDSTGAFELIRYVSQVITASLETNRISEFFRGVTQNIGIVFETNRFMGFFRSASQTINIASEVSRLSEFSRTASQAISITIQSVGARTGTTIRDVGLTISVALESSGLPNFFRSVTQAVSVSLSADGFKGFIRTVSQSIFIKPESFRLIDVTRSVRQSMTVMGYKLGDYLRGVSLAVKFALEGTRPGNPDNPGHGLFNKVFATIPSELSGMIVPLFFVVAILVGLKISDQIFDTGVVPDVVSVLGDLSRSTWILIAVLVMLLVLLAGINI